MSENLFCSLCEKSVKELDVLVVGENASVCHSCALQYLNVAITCLKKDKDDFETQNAELKARNSVLESRIAELEAQLEQANSQIDFLSEVQRDLL